MNLDKFLSDNRVAILDAWFNEIAATYPPDTANFLKNKKDRFANPVGQTILHGLEGLMAQLIASLGAGTGLDCDKTDPLLDAIVRIRAVQEFKPSEAVAFLLGLKKIVAEHAEKAVGAGSAPTEAELAELGKLVDGLSLRAFDIYMGCKEKLYELRANEARNLTFRLLQRAKLLSEKEEFGTCFLNFKNADKERKEVVK